MSKPRTSLDLAEWFGYCKHDGSPVAQFGQDDRLCAPCLLTAENAGAAWADKHWADNPEPIYEMTPFGEIIGPFDREYQHKQNLIARGEKEE